MKFNMKDWKKVADHPDHVQMRNQDGHELKIAKKALSPGVRKHMEELPIHKDDGGGIPGGGGSPAYSATGPVSGLKKPGDESTEDKSAGDQIKEGWEAVKSAFGSGDTSTQNKAYGGKVKHYADGGQAENQTDSPDQIAADSAPQAPAVNVNVGTPPQLSLQDQQMAMRYGPPKTGDEPFQPAGYQPQSTPYTCSRRKRS